MHQAGGVPAPEGTALGANGAVAGLRHTAQEKGERRQKQPDGVGVAGQPPGRGRPGCHLTRPRPNQADVGGKHNQRQPVAVQQLGEADEQIDLGQSAVGCADGHDPFPAQTASGGAAFRREYIIASSSVTSDFL